MLCLFTDDCVVCRMKRNFKEELMNFIMIYEKKVEGMCWEK